MTVEQVAVFLSFDSLASVRELHNTGRLRGIRLGKRIMFRLPDVLEYIDQLLRESHEH